MAASTRHEQARLAAPETLAESPFLEDRDAGGFARATLRLAFLGVAAFMAWAAVTPVREAIDSQGVVLPDGFVRRVEHLEGGIVGSVAVREGDVVRAGEALVLLDQAALQAERRRVLARREWLAREIERQIAFAAGDGLLAPAPAATGSAIARSQSSAAAMAEAHRAARLAVLRTELELRRAEEAALSSKRRTLTVELEIIDARFRQFDEAYRGSGAVSGVARDNVALQKIRLESEIAQLDADARSAALRTRMAEENEAEFLAGAGKEALLRVAELEGARAQADEELSRLEDALARGVLVAPVDGVVQSLAAASPGEVLPAGALVAEIVPKGAALFVEVMLPAEQIGKVSVGMAASVKALTFDYLRYGDVAGTVETISPSSIADAKGALRYRLRLRLDAPFVGSEQDGRRLSPGMTVTASLRGRESTVLETLLRPLRVMADRALTEG
ncbi:HlyD family type I secretion periplasmic adaptor subunit [Rubrimonas cliftonensis]|uniref:Membrane fusion protein (MFP) family protein n=1 Tax=Rubrimonas cliftonensis TaxID=89524 RepID=A0A1H4DJL3_9RHOB|nr:HlyD family type I secretion periplasmic adaptor subunit [Rubrimonas cliftonensis]SEA73023.1 HlyD family secretion protein/membrane fusion protein, adhesin transport system [Rubrimonas cliftonensis]